MASNTQIRLGDVAEILMGQSPPSHTYNEEGRGLPFFQGVRDFNYRFPATRVFCTSPTRIAEPGDILLSIRAPIGRVNVAWERCAIGRGLAIIRPRDRQDLRYIEFVLRHLEPHWGVLEGGGSVFGNAKRSDLESLPLPWPDAIRRRRIAAILGALDDKIELNRRMSRTLERIAAAIFKSWFIDFDPVRAKAEGRDPGLPADIADLFPDSFQDSPLGPIPKGWTCSTIGEEFNLTMGQSPPGKTYNESREGVPFFQGRRDFGFRYPINRVYCTAPTRFAARGDTLMSVRAPVGDVNMALERCSIGRGVAAARHKSTSASYTYYAFRSLKERFDVYNGQGTVFGSISQKDLRAISWLAPDDAVVSRFDQMAGPIDHRIELNEVQNRRLAGLRDTLLPKLLSGEIDVSALEGLAEEVAE